MTFGLSPDRPRPHHRGLSASASTAFAWRWWTSRALRWRSPWRSA